MPGLVRKLLIFAAAEGVLLQPVTPKSQSPVSALSIDYKTNTISPHAALNQGTGEGAPTDALEAHGVVGLLKLASTNYLVSISRREQIAQIRGKSVYVITDVTLIPLCSQTEAQNAINYARKGLEDGKKESLELAYSSDDDEDARSVKSTETDVDNDTVDTRAAEAAEPPKPGAVRRTTTAVQDVIQNRGSYGRFAQKWFSKRGWQNEGRRNLGMSSEENLELTPEQKKQAADALPDDENTADETDPLHRPTDTTAENADHVPRQDVEKLLHDLTPKILQSTKLFFASRSFYFSYDYDISRSLSRQEPPNTASSVPLYKRFDPLFFWNRNLISPLVAAGQSNFVLPLIQGFVGQRAFTISPTHDSLNDEIVDSKNAAEDVLEMQERCVGQPQTESQAKDFLLTLISRRSVKRAGLRYLRRGVDDEGNVANSVETEQILSSTSWHSNDKTFSLMQIRGSIPLFFSQSPYQFKPVPVQYGSQATNDAAFRKHLTNVTSRYGDVQMASLVDKHGNEIEIGTAYQKYAERLIGDTAQAGLDGHSLGFEWFDFHHECRGMKFENVNILLETLRPFMSSHGWTVQHGNSITQKQTGVLRTNCMDCLDRTNVVQSAVAGKTLQAQLQELGLSIDLQTDPRTSWFNTLWADNGDAISKQYAGTAALKGDFTRTRQRHWTGALSDFSLTLNRYYNNIFGDYFLQTCIDFYLGNAGPSTFQEFETDMMTKDYAIDVRRVRQNAIESCVRIVLADPDEDLLGGWALATPKKSNDLRSLPFEECILLLTDTALYFCRFDWTTEKVGSFERVPLSEIRGVNYGAYITSTLGPSHMDETKNVGFVVQYHSQGAAMVRTNTRSLANEQTANAQNEGQNPSETDGQDTEAAPPQEEQQAEERPTTCSESGTDGGEDRILAFKALPPRDFAATEKGGTGDAMTEGQLVSHICEEIERAATRNRGRTSVDAATAAAPANKKVGDDKQKESKQETGDQEAREVVEENWKVEKKDVIGLSEAKRSTTYFETLGYSLKKLVWS